MSENLIDQSKRVATLITTEPKPSNIDVVMIGIERLEKGKFQCRKIFQDIEELAESIEDIGIAQPLLVRQISHSDKYEIIAGERRWRAAQLALLERVPCIIRNCDDHEAWKLALHENLQRESLTPIEEARGYYDAIEEWSFSHAEIAKQCGVSREKVTNRIRLLGLPNEIQSCIECRKSHLEVHHGIKLATPKLNERQKINLSRQVERQKWSVAQLDRAIKRVINPSLSKRDSDTARFESIVSDALGCEVKLNKGRLTISYHDDLEILDGILFKLGLDED